MVRSSRKWWSGVVGIFWFLLFVLGIYQVFLFLHGYPPFSFGNSQKIQSGYATFSSDSSLFLDGFRLGSGEVYERYAVGEYHLCAEKLGFQNRCQHVEVLPNDQLSIEIRGIQLVKDPLLAKTLVAPLSPFFLPEGRGMAWYDSEKKQGFVITSFSEGVDSFFVDLPMVESFTWDSDQSRIILTDEVGNEDFVSLEMRESDFSKSRFSFTGNALFKDISVQTLFDRPQTELVTVFQKAPDQVIPVEDNGNALVVFRDDVFFFSADLQDFRWVTKKDPKTSVVYQSSQKELFFVEDGNIFYTSLY